MTAYPSDAPLPGFEVTKVQGANWKGVVVFVKFDCVVTNWDAIKAWLISRGYNAHALSVALLPTDLGYQQRIVFTDGVTTGSYATLRGANTGVNIHFSIVMIQFVLGGVPDKFSLEMPFCNVDVPVVTDLPSSGVWTDLQFKQNGDSPPPPPPPPPPSPTIAARNIGTLGVPSVLLYRLWRLRERFISKEVHKKLHPLV